MTVPELLKRAKALGVEGVTSRTKKADLEKAIARAEKKGAKTTTNASTRKPATRTKRTPVTESAEKLPSKKEVLAQAPEQRHPAFYVRDGKAFEKGPRLRAWENANRVRVTAAMAENVAAGLTNCAAIDKAGNAITIHVPTDCF